MVSQMTIHIGPVLLMYCMGMLYWRCWKPFDYSNVAVSPVKEFPVFKPAVFILVYINSPKHPKCYIHSQRNTHVLFIFLEIGIYGNVIYLKSTVCVERITFSIWSLNKGECSYNNTRLPSCRVFAREINACFDMLTQNVVSYLCVNARQQQTFKIQPLTVKISFCVVPDDVIQYVVETIQ